MGFLETLEVQKCILDRRGKGYYIQAVTILNQ
jgi:hypothetical protein